VTVPVIVLPEAERDLAEAFAWYEEQRPGLGRGFLDEAEAIFARISEFPLAFPAVEDAVRRGFLKRFPFAVYFLTQAAVVTVYAVLHHRREPGIWNERLGL
jgi:plasmid stabilization system protein ParE